MTECVFCGIASGEIPANMVFHDDAFVAFNDISPKSPIHIVVIPRQHITSLCEVDQLPPEDRARMPVVLSEVARQAGLEKDGYRVVTNHGPDSRQSVFHLHWHVLGGALLSDSM